MSLTPSISLKAHTSSAVLHRLKTVQTLNFALSNIYKNLAAWMFTRLSSLQRQRHQSNYSLMNLFCDLWQFFLTKAASFQSILAKNWILGKPRIRSESVQTITARFYFCCEIDARIFICFNGKFRLVLIVVEVMKQRNYSELNLDVWSIKLFSGL